MNAETLNCPNCGAAVANDATVCSFCKSRLATVACPSCFGMIFDGSKYCSHCGTQRSITEHSDMAALACPRCSADMRSVSVGNASVSECSTCEGLWVTVAEFEKICADREQQALVLGAATIAAMHAVDLSRQSPVRYVPCPVCKQLMNRLNFARCSGVIVDVCKNHGTWFDRDELREIVEFIRHGGLDNAREREKARLDEQRRELAAEHVTPSGQLSFSGTERPSGAIGFATELFKFFQS